MEHANCARCWAGPLVREELPIRLSSASKLSVRRRAQQAEYWASRIQQSGPLAQVPRGVRAGDKLGMRFVERVIERLLAFLRKPWNAESSWTRHGQSAQYNSNAEKQAAAAPRLKVRDGSKTTQACWWAYSFFSVFQYM
jgi:hypothetical protein